MRKFLGTYYGVTPTDTSATAFGEVEAKIEEGGVILRRATGFALHEACFHPSDFVTVAPEEVVVGDRPEHVKLRRRLHVSRHRTNGLLLILFGKPSLRDPDLLIRNWETGVSRETNVPFSTMLVRTDRPIAHRLLRAYIKWSDLRTRGGVPLLSRDGKTARR